MAAIAATLPGASWQRCRTDYAANLMAVTPQELAAMGQGAAALDLRPARRPSVHAQCDRVVDALAEKLPAVADVDLLRLSEPFYRALKGKLTSVPDSLYLP